MRGSTTPRRSHGPDAGVGATLAASALLVGFLVAVAVWAVPAGATPAGWPAAAGHANVGGQQGHTEAAGREDAGQEGHAEEAGQEAHGEAAGEEHAAEDDHEPAPWWEFPARLVNFGLLLALLWWGLVRTPPAIGEIFSFPGLAPLLANRASQIQEDKAVARERKEEAAEILTTSAGRLDRIEVEVAELVEDAREDAEREKRRAEEEGREQAEKIRETARRELRAESLGAQRELRGFVADLAVGMARTTLQEHLTAADQERLRKDYLSRLGAQLR